MAWTCKKCGKGDLAKHNRKGHYRFSGGEHGGRGELPDDWEQHFELVPDDEEEAAEELKETLEEEFPDADVVTSKDVQEGNVPDPTDDENDEAEDSDESPGRLKRALHSDVRALWNGDK